MIKIKKSILCLLSLSMLACQQQTQAEEAVQETKRETVQEVKKLNEKHQFKVRGCAINYNGTDLYLGKDIQPWIDALGEDYRMHDKLYGDPAEVYIYDDIGVRVAKLLRDDNELVGLYFNTRVPKHAMRYTEEATDEDIYLPKNHFEDAFDFEGKLIGSYLMTPAMRIYLINKSSVSYAQWTDCTEDQKKNGGMNFALRIYTTFGEPETIQRIRLEKSISFYSKKETEIFYKYTCLGMVDTTDFWFKSSIKSGECSKFLNKDATLKPEFLAEYNERKRKGILHEDEIYTDYYNDDGTVNIKYIPEGYINPDGTVDDSFTERNEYLSDSVE